MEEANNTTVAAGYANDGISSIGTSELGSSKCDLVADGGPNPNEHFERKYGEWWPFRLMKAINLLVLLAITIAAANCVDSDLLTWSRCWDIVRPFYDPSADWNNPDQLFEISVFILALAFISFVLHLFGKKISGKWPQCMASFVVMDVCLSLFMVFMLAPILYSFTCRSIAEIRWYHPILMMSKDEWAGPSMYSTWDLEVQKSRRSPVIFRLWMDSTIAILTFLAILLNLLYAVHLRRLFKLAKVWSSDYCGAHPNCSKLDMAYAKFLPFGFLKVAQWILPLVAFSLRMYVRDYSYSNNNVAEFVTMAIITLFWFFQWLFYVQTVHLNPGSIEKQQKQHDLARRCKKDLVYSGAAVLVYLFVNFIIFSHYQSFKLIQLLLIVLIVLHAVSALFTISNAGPNAFSGLLVKIPGLSVNISIDIHKYDVALMSAIQKTANANVEKGGENAK